MAKGFRRYNVTLFGHTGVIISSWKHVTDLCLCTAFATFVFDDKEISISGTMIIEEVTD